MKEFEGVLVKNGYEATQRFYFCSDCKYLHTRIDLMSDLKEEEYTCRLNPPIVGTVENHFTRWPFVNIFDWCSKFEPSSECLYNYEICKKE
jgi:hypothetical protein